ncbi:molecular chaperone HtpG [Pseudidiomarina sp. 1APP75-32.1]|uniref:Chaperone protein HtpG n=1 Tax=Pseudidiomarina terrestris TaxID=2820060 RepID=A0AAW7QU43_9GAMM|nr:MULTISPECIES: molecular chaperone HtpG [unclassified Pseudidiomarina]MDN7123403.1 molecular chaperone HtpG [Pseudidiomarina sp. 1APP75-32.1]MDN7127765.1 molecular chaperone HtpG [Pseudidiomarina sp. 1APR75-33.1]MDN7128872.1 molecular chaperone HtpG [Pseudidiomarina sp. 1APR75-15]MDN7137543.1 molecular chaperone HtpG [Pseudidiomarina sp. 1ASP75-14]MEA3587347.1 molecular chaperone HtpG [Pseudidiomarina sp. 1APP75-27a]
MAETRQAETHGFQTEVKQLLHLMIHSLYSNKEIFLRELVSNASDAADKLRFKALSDSKLIADDAELRVRVSVDKDAGTITISDNGVGMTREEVMSNLGTIAKSGTSEFFSQLSGDDAKDSRLIGQFGVGFYSAFIVADSVTVRTRAAGTDSSEGVEWTSKGEGEFDLRDIEKAQRGTDIILHVRDDAQDFLDESRLRGIITKYSDHLSIPVQMPERDDDGKTTEWQAVNSGQALWTREKSEISDEEYQEFYKTIAHDFEDPLLWSHNKVEGTQEYTSLLYIPKRAPWDLWNREQQHGIKLYVKRVFIMDDAQQLMPTYLRFVRGLMDSNDLPLNVSREILQDNKITRAMRSGSTKKVLGMLSKLAKDDPEAYQGFWNTFGSVLKEGPAEDHANQEKIAGLLRFASTQEDKPEATFSLDDYIGRMSEQQDKIYYIVADSYEAARDNPALEIFRKKGIEVLLLSERIDEWLMSHLSEYKEHAFQSVTRGDLDLGDLEDEEAKQQQEELEKTFEEQVKRFATALGEKVKSVRVTHRLTSSPACIVTDDNDMSTQMAKLMEAAGQPVPETKYIFEVNPEHALVQRVTAVEDEARFAEWAQLLLDQATLAERGSLKDPAQFVTRLNRLMMELTDAS